MENVEIWTKAASNNNQKNKKGIKQVIEGESLFSIKLCRASWLPALEVYLHTLFRKSGGWGPRADERVIYEQTGHQDGVVRKLWRSVWTCG